jgi:hypothetical protein
VRSNASSLSYAEQGNAINTLRRRPLPAGAIEKVPIRSCARATREEGLAAERSSALSATQDIV